MLKNDTLKNGTSCIGLYGSAPLGIVVTLLDLKMLSGEVHHNIIPVIVKHHHVPEEIVNIVKSLYVQFHTTVTTSRFSTEFFYLYPKE